MFLSTAHTGSERARIGLFSFAPTVTHSSGCTPVHTQERIRDVPAGQGNLMRTLCRLPRKKGGYVRKFDINLKRVRNSTKIVAVNLEFQRQIHGFGRSGEESVGTRESSSSCHSARPSAHSISKFSDVSVKLSLLPLPFCQQSYPTDLSQDSTSLISQGA